MSKRLQVIFSDDAWQIIENISHEANDGFEVGSINYSDVINELILCSKIDLKTLQLKHTDVRRSLKVMAAKSEIDLDSAIRALTELKAKITKRKVTQSTPEVSDA